MSVCGLRRHVCATEVLILLWTMSLSDIAFVTRRRRRAKCRPAFHASRFTVLAMSDSILARIIHEGSLRKRADAKRDGRTRRLGTGSAV
jgi:hypothetical protein